MLKAFEEEHLMTTPSVFKSPEGERLIMALYDKALAQWPVPHQTLTLPTRHGDTFVIASGDESAPPLVVLHGAGTSSAIWGADMADYCRCYRVYAVDLPGEAGKSSPNRPPWDTPAFAEWLADVFDALKIEQAALIGVSQGSWTAIKFAVANPARVSKLVLMCPGGVVPDQMGFFVKLMFWAMLGRRGLDRVARLMYGHQPYPPEAVEVMDLMMRHFKSRVGKLPIFTDEELRRLTMPTLLIGGDEDGMRDVDKIAARLGSLLPRLKVIVVPGAGHALLNTSAKIVPFLEADH
jgi:pimeloyl-ACP methyl ester carboxylesterase